jgi:hypothetical protein
MAQFCAFLDKVMQTNGNGVLGTISTITTTGLPGGVAAQFAMAKPPGAQFFYYNQTAMRGTPVKNGSTRATLSQVCVRYALGKQVSTGAE